LSNLKSRIIRILNDEELSGYSIYKSLLIKGIKSWPNHVYTLLTDMEKKDGLLQSRWVSEKKSTKKGDAIRKHLYSLSEIGKEEYENIIKDSLGVLMERFYKENLSLDDLPFHIELVNEFIGNTAKLSRKDSFKLVIASPSYHPLVCFPKFYYAISEAYPNSSIYVIKSPWDNILKPIEDGAKNLTFLNGSRNEIPLKDNFADYVLLQGFPKSYSISSTIRECMRVLKDDGCLFVDIPAIMSTEMRVPHNTVFPEYVLRLFYEVCGQDRIVRLEDVKRSLSNNFEQIKHLERRGRVIFFGFDKKKNFPAVQQYSRRLIRAGEPITG
jgi:DNA-binding PadR family transcriptional regulator